MKTISVPRLSISQQHDSSIHFRQRSPSFFASYIRLQALSKEASKPGEALQLFQSAREKLESKIKYSYLSPPGSSARDSRLLSHQHALLALLLWLYPNHPGFNQSRQAMLMFKHASAAVASSKLEDEAFALGLAIQLRVLPLLVRSKRVDEGRLEEVRKKALSFLSSHEVTSTKGNSDSSVSLDTRIERGILGIAYDGLAFSYYQFERDRQKAIGFFNKAIDLFRLESRELSNAGKEHEAPKRILSSAKKRLVKRVVARGSRISASLSMLKSKQIFYRTFAAISNIGLGLCYESQAENVEGELEISLVRSSRRHYKRAYALSKTGPWHIYKAMSSYMLAGTYWRESEYQLTRNKITECLKKAVAIGEESLKWFGLWTTFERDMMGGSWVASFYQKLARYSDPPRRRVLMEKSIELARKAEVLLNAPSFPSSRYDAVNIGDLFFHTAEYYYNSASKDETALGRSKQSVDQLSRALSYSEQSMRYFKEERYASREVESHLLSARIYLEMLGYDPSEGDEHRWRKRATIHCNRSKKLCESFGWNERLAETYWQAAQIEDRVGNFTESADYFRKASDAYGAGKRISEHGRIYADLESYMKGWNLIELAKAAHRSSDFESASKNYLEASRFIARARRWEYRSLLLKAESMIEKAEKLSMNEDPSSAIQVFQQAIEALKRFSERLQDEEVQASEDLTHLIELSRLLGMFCKARIILEKSKDAYKVGNLSWSINELSSAEKMFRKLASSKRIGSDQVSSSELDSLAALCNALGTFQRAQQQGRPSLYLKAQSVFSRAADLSQSKSLKPLLSGLSNFASFLFYSKAVENSLQETLDMEKVIECNRALEKAEMMFRRLGNKSFLNMLRASKHMLDATIKMSAAEREIESADVRKHLFAQARKSLSFASKYYDSLGSSKRVKEALRMIGEVQSHQKLIPLAHDIIAEVASTQIIYSAISSSSTAVFEQSPEDTARMMDSAYVTLDVDVPKPYATTKDTLSYSISLSNIGKQTAIAIRIDEIVPEGFQVLSVSQGVLKDRSLRLNTRIAASSAKSLTIEAKVSSPGDYVWHPSLIYLDEERKYRATKSQTARAVFESPDKIDLSTLIEEKEHLERQLQELSGAHKSATESSEQATSEIVHGSNEPDPKYFTLKERISSIEETVLRTRNELSSLESQLEQIREDIASLKACENDDEAKNLADLELEEKLLIAKIERRRELLGQAHLL